MKNIVKHPLDFFDYRIILNYLFCFVFILIGGTIAKDIFALLLMIVVLCFVIKKNLYRSIELWLFWFFSSGFYIGQGLITIGFVSKYIAKPSFLLFCIFLYFLPSIPRRIKYSKFAIYAFFLSLIIIISSVVHMQSPFTIISFFSFFFLYFLLSSKLLNSFQLKKLLNLFIAVALLQIVVSFMQVTGYIAPITTIMPDGSGGTIASTAGIDDVACGTFGPVSSHLVAWYASLISLLCFILWVVTKRTNYAIIAGASLAQFMLADSKTIMGVMILMMSYLFFFYFFKYKHKLGINFTRLISIILLTVAIFAILLNGWNFYYEYYTKQTDSEGRDNLDIVLKNGMDSSSDVIIKDWSDWGKIRGFSYVFNDFIEEGNTDVLFGYGIQGYDFNGKYGYILNKDTPIMQQNNSTNSNSGLITHFATLGVLGFVIFIYSCFCWYRFNLIQTDPNSIGFIINSLSKIFLIFTILAAFIYSVTFMSIPVIAFGGIIAILRNYSKDHEI